LSGEIISARTHDAMRQSWHSGGHAGALLIGAETGSMCGTTGELADLDALTPGKVAKECISVPVVGARLPGVNGSAGSGDGGRSVCPFLFG